MSTTKVAMNMELGVQKGPACDASQFTAMKRQSVIVGNLKQYTSTNGRKIGGIIIDGPRTRGSDSGVVQYYAVRGGYLNFLPYQ